MARTDYTPTIDSASRPTSGLYGRVDPSQNGNPAWLEWDSAKLPAPDMDVMRQYRLDRVRTELKKDDFAGAIVCDPLNIRYALDASNMQVWCHGQSCVSQGHLPNSKGGLGARSGLWRKR